MNRQRGKMIQTTAAAVAFLAGSAAIPGAYAQTADEQAEPRQPTEIQEQQQQEQPEEEREFGTRPGVRAGQERGRPHTAPGQTRDLPGERVGQTEIYEATDLEGLRVVTRDGERIGTVESLAVDLENEEVSFVVVESGGVLGIGSELKVVPIEAIEIGREERLIRDRDVVRLTIEEERWGNIPAYDPGEITLLCQEARAREVYDLFGIDWEDRRALLFGARDRTPAEIGERMIRTRDREVAQACELMLTRDLRGRGIRGAQQAEVANIDNVVVDLGSGRVHYVLLTSATGFLERTDQVYAVRPRTFQTITREEIVLDVTREQLERAESLTQETMQRDVGAREAATEDAAPHIYRYQREEMVFGRRDRETVDEERDLDPEIQTEEEEQQEEPDRPRAEEQEQQQRQYGVRQQEPGDRPEEPDQPHATEEEEQEEPRQYGVRQQDPEDRPGPPDDRPSEDRPPEERPPRGHGPRG